ncbi:tetratricopeptide repeat protein [Dyella amyloliquefaciens]|uniref:tetratricopeptide repeat protein n=1 Tax=Dyella amyloliquefaciens TaxID=1770545 RepID=UPI0013EE51ED|nr:tetratricopeptide repeat protein [Dyella amyloliquefaciens]
MTSRVRWLLVFGVLVVGGALGWATYLGHAVPPVRPLPPAAPLQVRRGPIQPPFTDGELKQFLKDARQAEAMADPLQRCLAYPEPPGVHWTKAVTSAYCHYLFDPVVTAAQARDLIENGHVSELEQKLSAAEQAQFSQEGAQSLLDRTYNLAFGGSTDDTRALMDAWKRQAPDSPFALAASGTAYVAMAQRQRGSAYAQKTPQSSFEAMHRLLERAREDLDRAVALDPRLTPAYVAMIYVGALDSDPAYAFSAAKRALHVDPASYPAYARLVWMSQPKWGGNVAQMQRIVDASQQHAKQNPLLLLLLSERSGGEDYVENCACNPFDEDDLYRKVFAEAAPVRMLMSAGWAAANRNNIALSVVYRSELLRFDPGQLDHRESRAFNLIMLGEPEWGLAEGNALVKLAPQDETAYDVLGQAHRALGDAGQAANDFEQALRLNPTDTWTLTAVGDIYVNVTHDWDKGWAVANRLVQLSPEDPRGWFMRANIQRAQPRDGLEQTIAEFTSRFGTTPGNEGLVAQMKAIRPQ